jgi:RNA polymerase sigma factor (sigma-70 family)
LSVSSSAPQTHTHQLSPEALERFRGGDRDAFVTVYDALAGEVRPLVARFFTSPFEREEAVQEVWMHVHRMSHAFDPARGPLGGWLRMVAINRCREILRARGRRPDPRQSLDDEALVADSDPEAEARAARVREALAQFSAGLAGEEASVLRLSLIEERPHDEVARALGITPRRCKYLRMKLLARAATDRLLRQALAEVVGS